MAPQFYIWLNSITFLVKWVSLLQIMRPGVYLTFTTGRKIRNTAGHINPQLVYVHMTRTHWRTAGKIMENDCNRRWFAPPAGFQINSCARVYRGSEKSLVCERCLDRDNNTDLRSLPTTSRSPTAGIRSARYLPYVTCLVYETNLSLSWYLRCIALPSFSVFTKTEKMINNKQCWYDDFVYTLEIVYKKSFKSLISITSIENHTIIEGTAIWERY